MAGGSFEVALVPLPDGGAHGMEQIEFRVAGHAGVPLRPLAKVASGGELARISLALSVIASAASPTPTLIFDEVDTGIGGGVAEVVGRLLHQLGEQRQVLCVTHLPQVAARGDHHFQVAKSSKGKKRLGHMNSPTWSGRPAAIRARPNATPHAALSSCCVSIPTTEPSDIARARSSNRSRNSP